MTGPRVLLAVLGGLAVAGGATGTWAARAEAGFGQVPLTVTGLDVAPLALPLGIAAVLTGVLVPLARGRARLAAALLLALLGSGAVVVVALGAVAAAERGPLAAGAGVAGAGALAVLTAAVLTGRRPSPPLLDERYTVEGRDDDEWAISAAETEAER